MAKRHMKRCLTLLIIREMQITTSTRYHFIPVRMTIIKKSTNNKCWRGYGETGPFYTVGKVNWYSNYGREYVCVCAKSLSCVRLCDHWTAPCQAPLSVWFSKQDYCSGKPFPFPGNLPDPRIEPGSHALQADSLPSEPAGIIILMPFSRRAV